LIHLIQVDHGLLKLYVAQMGYGFGARRTSVLGQRIFFKSASIVFAGSMSEAIVVTQPLTTMTLLAKKRYSNCCEIDSPSGNSQEQFLRSQFPKMVQKQIDFFVSVGGRIGIIYSRQGSYYQSASSLHS
jgi:hypothetical protein